MDEYSLSVYICDNSQALEASNEGLAALYEGLGRNILNHLGDVPLGRSLRIFHRTPWGGIGGGIIGELFGGWLHISLLWVDEQLRDRRLGSQLLQRLEHESVRLGCRHAHVDTFSFEARPFYEKRGYVLFATLDDYPEGHRKYFLKKALVQKDAPS
jgi:GNAT superfamily N-acetyltransferase